MCICSCTNANTCICVEKLQKFHCYIETNLIITVKKAASQKNKNAWLEGKDNNIN